MLLGNDGRGVVTVLYIDVVGDNAGLVAFASVVVGKLTAGLVAFVGSDGRGVVTVFAIDVVEITAGLVAFDIVVVAFDIDVVDNARSGIVGGIFAGKVVNSAAFF